MSTLQKYKAISPLEELLAYEALWDKPEATFRSLSQELNPYANYSASTFVSPQVIAQYKKELWPILDKLPNFGVRIFGDGEFPDRLNDAQYPIKMFYYQGNWELINLPSIAVVGTREPSPDGVRRAQYLVKRLVQDNFVIVSGLARGIDTVAHKTVLENHGNTIAVIGTPLNCYYPPENKYLQDEIATNHLLVSQVPFSRYSKQTYHKNRLFFPERNVTMSALTDATIIVEAGETSGTLVQARAALKQNRKLFILENNFLNPALTWPKKFQQSGAIRVKDYDEIRKHLTPTS